MSVMHSAVHYLDTKEWSERMTFEQATEIASKNPNAVVVAVGPPNWEIS